MARVAALRFRLTTNLLPTTTRRFFFFSSDALPSLEPSPDADMIAQILTNDHNPFHPLESSLQLHGVVLTAPLLHQTLLRLRHNSKIALALFNYSLSLPSSDPSAAAFNLLIDITSKVRQFDVAWQLVAEMDRRGVPPTTLTFSILVRRLIAAGLTRQAVRAFDDMAAFVPDPGYGNGDGPFVFLLDTLCKYGHVKAAVELFNKRKGSYRPCVRMYTVLVYGWSKIGRVDMAERFLREMIERGIEPNIVTYNVLLNGICRRAKLHPDGRFERVIRNAEMVFDEMCMRGIEPDVTSFSIILHVYGRAHKPDLTLERFRLMKEKGISPSVVTYSTVIKCLCSCGRMKEAEELLEEMARNGVYPNAATFNCFFKEYKGRKDAEVAMKLYRRMRDDGFCVPSVHTYNILLGMFLKWSRFDLVNEIWDDLKVSGLGPDLDSYTLVVHSLCEKLKWKEACQLFVEMIEKGLLPQKVTFETLYSGLIQSDMLRTWRRLKKRLDEEAISFGTEFQNYPLKPYRR